MLSKQRVEPMAGFCSLRVNDEPGILRIPNAAWDSYVKQQEIRTSVMKAWFPELGVPERDVAASFEPTSHAGHGDHAWQEYVESDGDLTEASQDSGKGPAVEDLFRQSKGERPAIFGSAGFAVRSWRKVQEVSTTTCHSVLGHEA